MNIPRTIQVTYCSLPGCWYEELVGVSFTVLDAIGDCFIVDEYDWRSNMMIPLTILKTDCKITER